MGVWCESVERLWDPSDMSSAGGKTDGGLRILLREYLPDGDWVSVETGATAAGVPDSNFCFSPGLEGWVEGKRATGWQVAFQPGQIGWHARRSRRGGRTFVAVRQMLRASDALFVVRGSDLEEWSRLGHPNRKGQIVCPLKSWDKCFVTAGGPARWDWARVRSIFCSQNM